VSLPGRTGRGVVVSAPFAETAILLPNRGEPTSLTTLMNWVADPVDACVTADLRKSEVVSRGVGCNSSENPTENGNAQLCDWDQRG